MKVMGRRSRGSALITAIFITLVLFFAVTAVTANIHREIRLARRSAIDTQLNYRAFGAANRAIADISEEVEWDKHLVDAPLLYQEGGYIAKVWFVQDEEHPSLIHVVSKVYQPDDEANAVTRTRVIRKSLDGDGAVYSLHFGGANSEVPSVLTRPLTGGDWELLPNPGKGLMMGMGAGVGELYSVTLEMSPLFQGFMMNEFKKQSAGKEEFLNWSLVFSGVLTGDSTAQQYLNPLISWKVSRYDQATKKWAGVHTFPSGTVAGVPFPDGDSVYVPTAGKNGSKLYRMSETGGGFTEIPGPASTVYDRDGNQIAGKNGGITSVNRSDGSLFAQVTYDKGSAIYRQNDNGGWDLLPAVPRSYSNGTGIKTEAGAAQAIILAGVTPQNEPVVVWRGEAEQYAVDGGHAQPDGLLIFRDGIWQPIDPPPSGDYNSDGDFVPDGNKEFHYQAASVDREGHIVTSHHHDGVDVLDYLDNGSWEALPPVPRQYNDSGGNPRVGKEPFQDNSLGMTTGSQVETANPDRFTPVSTY